MSGLTAEQLEQFDQDGYLVVEGVLGEEDLAAIEQEYREILDRVTARPRVAGTDPAAARSRGLLRALHRGDAAHRRHVHALPAPRHLPADGQGARPQPHHEHRIGGVRPSHQPSPARHRRIGHRARDLLQPGPAHPDQATRPLPARLPSPTPTSPPRHGTRTTGSSTPRPTTRTCSPSGWPSPTPPPRTGCLIVERGSHRDDLTMHCPGTAASATTYIPEAIIDRDRVVPLEVRAGGVVLLHKLTEHASLENHSESIRWSFDLRYQPIGQPTGRSVFPGFIARSEAHPEQVVTDPADWANLWWQARDRIVGGEVPMAVQHQMERQRQPADLRLGARSGPDATARAARAGGSCGLRPGSQAAHRGPW